MERRSFTSIIFLAFCMLCTNGFAATKMRIICGTETPAFSYCEKIASSWAAANNVDLTVEAIPAEMPNPLDYYYNIFKNSPESVDIIAIDNVWPSALAEHLVDLLDYNPTNIIAGHFPATISAYVVGGKLVGLPTFVDVGLLYYRKDLLDKYGESIPETWKQLERIALKVQKGERELGNSRFWGYVFQGKQYEGLTCNVLEWLDSFGTGEFIDAYGLPNVNNKDSIRALKMVKRWIGRLSPSGVLNMVEEDTRSVFQGGGAMFMRNWPYAWALMNNDGSPVKGKVGVTVLPKSNNKGRHAGTLGGWGLAVSKYSKHKEKAAELVNILSSEKMQKERYLSYSLNPTLISLYEDEQIKAKSELSDILLRSLVKSINRPAQIFGKHYNEASEAVSTTVHKFLRGEGSASGLLAVLENDLRIIMAKANR